MAREVKFFTFLQFQWDTMNEFLYRNKQKLHLRLKAAQALKVFLQHPGELISKAELKAAIWPESRLVENNSIVANSRTLGYRLCIES